MASRQEIQDMAAKVCGLLTDLGFEYHFEADNRANHKSFYIFVRRPKYTEIRVSDHPIGKVRRRKRFDIGPHAMSLDAAMKEIAVWAKE